ncbi:aminotransferase class V-fold PLP-dependent enzyme [Collinsella intestinalis]|nr:aminotransferase class V-fold PLP-dependent enzyme [Collinsella intestinalis]
MSPGCATRTISSSRSTSRIKPGITSGHSMVSTRSISPARVSSTRRSIRVVCTTSSACGCARVKRTSSSGMSAVEMDSTLPMRSVPERVAYVSEQTHSSAAKGLHMIGVPADHIRVIGVDGGFRMRTDELERVIAADEAAGLSPFLVIATAGTTNTGSVDPLRTIAGICRAHNLWMHVDGAFGASVLLTRFRDMLDGVELADSLSWDAHKWLFQTYSCGMVLVRDARTLLASFSTHPEYLADLEQGASEGEALANPWDLSPELTRPARGLKLWFTLQVMGSEGMAAAVEHGFDLARWAEDELRHTSDAQIVTPAQMAMVNFRFAPEGLSEEELDALNLRVSQRMLESGYAGVFTTELGGKKVLRICAIHPRTSEEEMREVIRRLAAYATEEAAR